MIEILFVYLLSFIVIWFGAGLIISAVDILSKNLRISRFALSFVVLGLLTSIPEFAVGLTAIHERTPEIFVGNLLGGIPVIFLFVIPVLAILGNGIRINHEFNGWKMPLTFAAIIIPSLLVLDGSVNNAEGIVMILMYFISLALIENKNRKNVLKSPQKKTQTIKLGMLFLKAVIGVILIYGSSQIIVSRTIYLAKVLQVSSFYISLIGVSLGTNLPELSLAIRSILQKKKDIAFGDYMGSAAANTLLFGVFTLVNHGESFKVGNFVFTFLIILTGLFLFGIFSRSHRDISRQEGLILMGLFCVFALFSFT